MLAFEAATSDEQRELQTGIVGGDLLSRQLELLISKCETFSVDMKVFSEKVRLEVGKLALDSKEPPIVFCPQFYGVKTPPNVVFVALENEIESSELLDRKFVARFEKLFQKECFKGFKVDLTPFPVATRTLTVENYKMTLIIVPCFQNAPPRLVLGSKNLSGTSEPSFNYNSTLLFYGQFKTLLEWAELALQQTNQNFLTVLQNVFKANCVEINVFALIGICLNYQKPTLRESVLNFLANFPFDVEKPLIFSQFQENFSFEENFQTKNAFLENKEPAFYLQIKRSINLFFDVQKTQLQLFAVKLQQILQLQTKSTNFLSKNLQASQFFGQNVFSLLLSRNSFILAPGADFSVKLPPLSQEKFFCINKLIQAAFDEFVPGIVKFAALNADKIDFYLQEKQFYLSKKTQQIIKGPLFNDSITSKVSLFNEIFGKAVEMRHFQNGEMRFCVLLPETAGIEDYLIQIVQIIVSGPVIGRTTSAAFIQKILPNFSKEQQNCSQIHEKTAEFRILLQDAFLNPKVNFSLEDLIITSSNASRAALKHPIYSMDTQRASISAVSADLRLTALGIHFKHYGQLVLAKQLMLTKLMPFIQFRPPFSLLSRDSTSFNVKILLENNEFFVLRINIKLMPEEFLLKGFLNNEKASFEQKLALIKPLHLQSVNSQDIVITAATQLAKRWLSAHLVPLYQFNALEIDFKQSIFGTEAFQRATVNKSNADFTPEELDELFRLSEEEFKQKVAIPASDLSCPGWISEEFVEQLVAWLHGGLFRTFASPLQLFAQFLAFVAHAPDQNENGMLLGTNGCYLEPGQLMVQSECDPEGFLNGCMLLKYFRAPGLKAKAEASLKALQAFIQGASVNPAAIFKTPVKAVSHICLFRSHVQFEQFGEEFTLDVDTKGAAEMEPHARLSHVAKSASSLIRLPNPPKNLRYLQSFCPCEPLPVLLPIFARLFDDFDVRFDVYGGRGVYLVLNTKTAAPFDLDLVRASEFATDSSTVRRSESYLISQGLLETGLFETVIAQKQTGNVDAEEIEVFEEQSLQENPEDVFEFEEEAEEMFEEFEEEVEEEKIDRK